MIVGRIVTALLCGSLSEEFRSMILPYPGRRILLSPPSYASAKGGCNPPGMIDAGGREKSIRLLTRTAG